MTDREICGLEALRRIYRPQPNNIVAKKGRKCR